MIEIWEARRGRAHLHGGDSISGRLSKLSGTSSRKTQDMTDEIGVDARTEEGFQGPRP